MEEDVTMEELLMNVEDKMTTAVTKMEERFQTIRAGRANPAILDGVLVSYYGTQTPLNQIASISIPEARQIAIKPFDKSSLGDIEKAIYDANLGLTPTNTGDFIIINIPALTEETRRDYVKQVKAIAEDARITLRNIRQDAKNTIKKEANNEDEEKSMLDEVQELTDKYNKVVEEKTTNKENELMKV